MSLSIPIDHSGARDSKQASQSMLLTGKNNTDHILALDEQIREHEKVLIELKRTRNSLLSVFKLPPEVLGKIFRWNVTLKDDFDGLEKESHNFLFVCHHWFQVASRTPELWSFWGNNLEDWTRWYPYSRTAPLDLVLDDPTCDDVRLDTALYNELQGRATRDIIRRVHLKANDPRLLCSIISSLTTKCEGTRTNSVESFVLCISGVRPADVSDFFVPYRFPKLQRLGLGNCRFSWNDLISRTGALTCLDIAEFPSPTPTTSQLLSLLASNPLLQKIVLNVGAISRDDDDTFSIRVPLHDLETLELTGKLRDVIRLFHRLDHPRRMDSLKLTLRDCSVEEISQLVEPVQDCLGGRGRSQHGLGLFLSFHRDLSLHIGDVHGINPLLRRMDTFMVITIDSIQLRRAQQEVVLVLLVHVPREEIVHFQTENGGGIARKVYPLFPNLRALSFAGGYLRTMFPEPEPDRDKEILVFLKHLSFQGMFLDRGDWKPLVDFLTCRASSGNRLDTVEISDSSHMHPGVMRAIGAMVRELGFDRQRPIVIQK